MAEDLQQLKEQLKTVKLRLIGIHELVELKIQEGDNLHKRQLILEQKVKEIESR